ncbi:MAG: glycosyltransferase [Candidatus Omnitrophica bacterium]|nr:glycosyltransferase [Candidatus Omnitrophota bacterium]
MKKPKVSIIMPTYNHGSFIKETLQSIFVQTFTDWELIIVNDGSTDDTEEILRSYLSRILYLKTSQLGQPHALNVGIRNAQGEYVAFADSDDLWAPEKLELQIKYLQDNPQVDAVYGDAVEFNKNGVLRDSYKRSVFDPNNMFESLIRTNRVPFPTVVCKKAVLFDIGLFDETLTTCNDSDLLIRIAYQYKIGFIDRILLRIRKHETNISSNPIRQFENNLRILGKVKKFKGLTDKQRGIIKSSLKELSFDLGYAHFSEYRFSLARKYFFQSFVYSNFINFHALRYFLITLLGKKLIYKLKTLRYSEV